MDFSNERQSYEQGRLTEAHLLADPRQQLERWLQEAVDAKVHEPYAMTLATARADGRPSARTVLLRELSKQGLVFYTHYDSAKGHDLAANPQAEALFYWPALERQARVYGRVRELEPADSDAYFQKRPRDSQIAAHVSAPQSGQIDSRQALDQRFDQLSEAWQDITIERPQRWGGYAIEPDYYEFWQGGRHRIHDRLAYQTDPELGWIVQRLMP